MILLLTNQAKGDSHSLPHRLVVLCTVVEPRVFRRCETRPPREEGDA